MHPNNLRISSPCAMASAPSLASPQNNQLVDASLFHRFGFGRREQPPFRCVHHAFEHHVLRDPEAVAVSHLGDKITYGDLDRRANALAHRLRAMGVLPGARVCLLVQRSIPMVVGIMAILKAGGAYVPLDGGIVTDSTLGFVVRNAKCALVLTLTDYVHRLADVHIPIIDLDEEMKAEPRDSSKVEDMSSPDDSAYIIYTSGEWCNFIEHVNTENLIWDPRDDGNSKGSRGDAS